MFVLDTNIFVYHTAGDAKIADFVESNAKRYGDLAVPTVCLVEFLSYFQISIADKENFLSLTRQLRLLPLDYQNALVAAELRSNYRLKVADSIVAAAAVTQNAVLVSRDKDFKKIKEIEVIDL